MKEIAIIGPTASGKSDLALALALEHDAYILSVDSLSVYREIDIASAKPTEQERMQVRHFGIDELRPDEPFDVSLFFDCYRRAAEAARRDGKHLIIVGGTGFYLKRLFDGLSPIPAIREATREKAQALLRDQAAAYALLCEADPAYMARIEPTDRYRTEKMLLIYLESGLTPTQWFERHPPEPVVRAMPLFEIEAERGWLRERIALRTRRMADQGLIDEVAALEHKYGRDHPAMKAIGIVETLEYLDGMIDRETMIERIATHTAQLAKRQQTFNRNQFDARRTLDAEAIREAAGTLFTAP